MAQSALWEKAQEVKEKKKNIILNKMKYVISHNILSFTNAERNQGANAKQSWAQKKNFCFYTFLHTKDLQPVANTLSTLGIIDKHNAWWRFPGMTHSLLWTVPNIRGLDNTICRFAAPQIRYFSWICFVNYPTKHHKIIKRAKALFNIPERPCQMLVGRRFWGFKKKKKVNKHPDVI